MGRTGHPERDHEDAGPGSIVGTRPLLSLLADKTWDGCEPLGLRSARIEARGERRFESSWLVGQ